ncbi:hypothetical protein [Undibacterium sp. RuRC25W]|uniref:hypothetical protein n=1 Tax=Undibacterium sp. RuRC25W TaxID=3413047 RepID=UPI003BF34901
MKKLILAALVAGALFSASAGFAQGVNVSVSVGEPGFYGQIDIGHVSPPAVVYAQPVIVGQPAVGYVTEPLYLRVPPEHFRHWKRYCDYYHACGRRVYFVQDNWYSRVYAPQYREHAHEWYPERGHEHYEERGRQDHDNGRRDDRHDDRHDDRRGEHHEDRHDGRGENRGEHGEHGENQGR